MHAEFTTMSLPELVERLADFDDRRTPAGWTLEDAVLRSSIERCVLERLTAPVRPGVEIAPELPCSVAVRMRSGAIAAAGRVRALLPGGLLIESSWPWLKGASVELQLQAAGAELGPRLKGTVVRERSGDFVVALPAQLDEASERRLRRFLLELIRARVES